MFNFIYYSVAVVVMFVCYTGLQLFVYS